MDVHNMKEADLRIYFKDMVDCFDTQRAAAEAAGMSLSAIHSKIADASRARSRPVTVSDVLAMERAYMKRLGKAMEVLFEK